MILTFLHNMLIGEEERDSFVLDSQLVVEDLQQRHYMNDVTRVRGDTST